MIEPSLRAENPIAPETRIGHVHLRTADIDRVRDFYVGVLGFDGVFEARDVPGWGTTGDVLFLSGGGIMAHPGGPAAGVTSIREVDWARFEPNFFVVFAPGALEQAPQTLIALTRIDDPAVRGRFQRQLVEKYAKGEETTASEVRRRVARAQTLSASNRR